MAVGDSRGTRQTMLTLPLCNLFVVSVWILVAAFLTALGSSYQYGDAEHITAILEESVVLNCAVSQPETPYIIQWKRQHQKIPIYIWYDGYDPHVEDTYKGRASRVNLDSNFGLASLNLTSVRESDQGWYECNVFYLDRTGASDNGTWIHLDVHAPPRFVTTPDDVTYVNIGDSIILSCEAEGTPTPEIMWFRDDKPVKPSDSVGIFNDGTELRINKIRDEDIGDYLCVARNAEGRVVHDARVVIAGGAVIVNPPHNLTRLEGEKAEFPCEAKALPGNVTVVWKRENVPIDQLSWLDTRSVFHRDGTLTINPTSADDGGFFTCEVSNGIGTPQRATAHLNVEYPARVTYTPTVQYLPFRQQGIIKCHIKSNPEIQFVTWIKDKRLFDPDAEEGVVRLKNGSLLITKVNQSHQGRYSCTPYNRHTTAGSSGDMEVLVREPPVFSPRPQAQYHGQVGEEVTLVCGGKGSPTPGVTWRKRDGQNLPRDRTVLHGGNLTIRGLHKIDHGYYECEVKNEIMAIVAATQLLVEGTTPHPPYNITTDTKPFSVKLTWLPGYPGGRHFDQKYTIWYRMVGQDTWSQIEVKPAGSTSVTIHNLSPESTYEFQVQGKNELGDGMFSEIVTTSTKANGGRPSVVQPSPVTTTGPKTEGKGRTPGPKMSEFNEGIDSLPTNARGNPYFPIIRNPRGPSNPQHSPQEKPAPFDADSLPLGPRPNPPTNVTIRKLPHNDRFVLSWLPPEDTSTPVQYYDIEYQREGGWKKLNEDNIVGQTSYTVTKLKSGKTYKFRVLSKTMTNFHHSEEITFKAPIRSKEKEITAAVVGGILFFIVAIILSVCTVKICNKRKRKKQEKAYNMVSCRVGDTLNGGQKSPVPLKRLLWCGISSVKHIFALLFAVFVDHGILDITDSRTIDSSSSHNQTKTTYDESDAHGFPYKVKVNYNSPYNSITRSREGKFVPDQDSEEGGFTSNRRPIRSLQRNQRQISPYSDYYRPIDTTHIRRRPRRRESRATSAAQWNHAIGNVQTGVYHVRTGTASRIQNHPHYSRLQPLTHIQAPIMFSPGSPEFGRHVIPDSPPKMVLVTPRKVLSSSPRPYANQWSQLTQLASFSEMSSVRQPSSAERSFPSTVLSSFQRTPSAHGTPMQPGVQTFHFHPDRYRRDMSLLRNGSRQIHIVDAQVHSPPDGRGTVPSGAMFYPNHSHATPQKPFYGGYISPYHSYSHQTFQYPLWQYRNMRSDLYSPPYREYRLPTLAEIPPHYVNLPPLHRSYQINSNNQYELLKSHPPAPAPLATSSPPRSRHPRSHLYDNRIASGPSTNAPVPEIPSHPPQSLYKEKLLPEVYARNQLQKPRAPPNTTYFIPDDRPHSAPLLSSAGQTGLPAKLLSLDSRSKQPGKNRDSPFTSQEASHEQSPDSSSGFGSKNTSQQQNSSQSAQSASALGLDSSKFDVEETPSWEKAFANRPYANVNVQHGRPPSYEHWLSRQVLPQFRPPGTMTIMERPGLPQDLPPLISQPISLPRIKQHTTPIRQLEKTNIAQPLSIDTANRMPGSRGQVLDVSVDDPYEFDTALSPTPGDDAAIWTRARTPSGERGLSDSEVYSSGGRRRQTSESTEARVAAMKEEFHEYRRKQAQRRRSREMESMC